MRLSIESAAAAQGVAGLEAGNKPERVTGASLDRQDSHDSRVALVLNGFPAAAGFLMERP